MSEKYLPLFRKYRPQSFKDVVGQENLVKALSNAIELHRVANAYLLCGPRGTGKTSSARILAKSLNCVNGPTVNPCQLCPSCIDITNASGLDVIEIDAATNRGIDDAKELISQAQYAPMNGKYKIFIIDEVHMLSNEAFNALLKTFEEPPANVIFILATTEPHKVIETIVSRCQRFDLRRITTDDIVKRLKDISGLEKINITDDALFTIAKNVSGGLRDSLALLDQVSILGVKESITKETIEELLGKVTFDVLFNFTKNVLTSDIETCLKLIDSIYIKGSEPRNFTENFIEFIRNLVFTLNSKDTASILKFSTFNKSDIEKIKADSGFESAKIIKILDKVVEYYKEIKYATNPYLWVELMIIAVCTVDSNDVNVFSRPMLKASAPALSVVTPETITQETVVVQNVAKEPVLPQEPVIEPTGIEPVIAESAPIRKHVADEPDITEQIVVQKLDVLATKQIDYADITEPIVVQKPKPIKIQEQEQEPSAEVADVVEIPKVAEIIERAEIHKAAETQSAPSQSDSVAAWMNVLNIIESVPAKFFYSGVGKLIGLEDNSIVLGFVNENALSQAKSDSKYKPLLKAVKIALGDSFEVEFRLITQDTKVIDVKLTAKISEKPKHKPIYVDKLPTDEPQQNTQNKPDAINIQESSFSKEPNNAASSSQEPIDNLKTTEYPESKNLDSKNIQSDEDKVKTAVYSEKTKDMLEAFNGKMVE